MKHRLTEGEAIERLFWTILFVSLAAWQTLQTHLRIGGDMKKLLIALILLLAAPVWAGPYIEYVTPSASETVAGTTERCTDAEVVILTEGGT